jgi:hypothetical protein
MPTTALIFEVDRLAVANRKTDLWLRQIHPQLNKYRVNGVVPRTAYRVPRTVLFNSRAKNTCACYIWSVSRGGNIKVVMGDWWGVGKVGFWVFFLILLIFCKLGFYMYILCSTEYVQWSGRQAIHESELCWLELWTLFPLWSPPYMVMVWICVLWLGAVQRTDAVTSALPDKGMRGYLSTC